MVSEIMYSSKDSTWGTPPAFFGKVDNVFGFNLDVCATEDNAKTERFISPEENAFVVDWNIFGDRTVAWMNPPYGRGEKQCVESYEKCKKKKCRERGYHMPEDIPGVSDWVHRASYQALEHGITLVSLIPARTETEWFQTVFTRASLICFVRQRLRFVGAAKDTAPFPSVVAVFSDSDNMDNVIYEEMTEIGNVIDPRGGQILVYGGGR
jgi:phage N-6-adenine-methyltransferase